MVFTSLAFYVLAASFQAKAPELVPGKPAPDLVVGGWLKSEAPKPQKGHWRVVEFWATWCVPCKQAMPHLSELARKYRDRLDVVGVSVSEYKGTTTDRLKQFVDEMGDKMDYRVAYDTPAGTMNSTWLVAAGQNSIPSTFLLDDKGTILWIGHPNNLEKQLELAFSGKTNVETARAEYVDGVNWLEGSRAEIAKAEAAYKAGSVDEADKIWDAALTRWPRSEFLVRKSRLDAYPFGSAKNATVVDQMIASRNATERGNLMIYAGAQVTDRATAEKIVDRSIEGVKDETLLYKAAFAYNKLQAYGKAIKCADAGLGPINEKLADSKWEPLWPLIKKNKEKFVEVREAAAKALQKNPE